MKQRKQALAKSLLALLCCLAMLIGTTFAWFTDSVVSGYNTIAAGNLDVELYHSNATVTNQKVTTSTKLFLDLNGNSILWEPGVVSYENLRVVNEGDLALIYQLAINTANENFILDNGAQYGLSQVLKVGVVKGGITATDRDDVIASVTTWTTLSAFLREGSLEANAEEIWGIVIYWQPGDNDNNWNANNGKQLSSGDALTIDLGIKLTATQEQFENDSFGNDYDADAKEDLFPVFNGSTASVPVTPDANGYTTEDVTIIAGDITALVPAGTKLGNGVDKLTLSVSNLAYSESNVMLGDSEAMRSLNVHVDGVADDNTTPITITLPEVAPVSLNMGNYQVYHVENNNTNEMTLVANDADFTAHNQFKYDPATGNITLHMASFSEVALVAEFAKWEGNIDHSWYDTSATQLYIANGDQLYSFGQIVGGMAEGIEQDDFAGKTVTLIANINLDDVTDENSKIFHPIGYYYNGDDSAPYSTVYSFDGTFDGNGHTIANFYQNTWEIKGDYEGTYYKDAMGLFGYVVNATIKNLTVKNFSSDGEFTPTGVIAAYACNSTFENIAIVDCNPRVYNTGNGGIVGIGGNDSDPDSYKLTFTNITVDNSNKITALWGSWDVACGGLVGMFRGAGHAYMTNCHVGAQIDVYNDVCGNYQYYWYRYAGSLIGTNKNMITDANGYTVPETDKYHATNCTVHFGDWNDYYYCELVANSLASYTHDHQMSRLTIISSLSEIKSGNTWTKTGNFLLFDGAQQKQDGEGTCYHIVKDANGNLVQHFHEDAGYDEGIDENSDGADDLKEDKQRLYLPFNQIFTGYGWGVKHIPVGEFDGVTILDRTIADSVEKFEIRPENYVHYFIENGSGTVLLGNLFKAKSNAMINNSGVMVSIDKVNDNDNVSGVYTANISNWTLGSIHFTGKGLVKITIQDYEYCKPTTLYLNVTDTRPTLNELDAGTTTTNLTINGDFEQADLQWYNITNEWNMLNNTQGYTSSAEAHTGNQSMLVKFINTWHAGAYQTINVEPNTEYKVSLWQKSAGDGSGTPRFVVGAGNNVSGTKLAFLNLPIGNTTWTNHVVAFNSGEHTQVTLYFYSQDAIGNNQYIDNITMDKAYISDDGYIKNGQFEDGFWSNWNNIQASWGGLTNVQGAPSSAEAHSGTQSMKVNFIDTWHHGAAQTVVVEPYTDYKISLWDKAAGTGTGTPRFVVSAGSSVDGTELAFVKLSNKTSWNNQVLSFNSGENNRVTIFFSSWDSQNNVHYIDDIKMDKVYTSFDGFVLNGEFECGKLAPWSNITTQWGSLTNTQGYLSDAVSHSGKQAMQVQFLNTWHKGAYQTITVKPNTQYTITMWQLCETTGTGTPQFLVIGGDVNGTNLVAKNLSTGNTTWTKQTITFNSGDNDEVTLCFYSASAVGSIHYIDDITIAEG